MTTPCRSSALFPPAWPSARAWCSRARPAACCGACGWGLGDQEREPLLAELSCRRRPGPVLPADHHARTDQQESPDKIEPTLAAEPIEKAEATEPTEPTERIEPADPMDKIEPAEPMDKIEPLDPMLRSEPAEPLERGEPSVFCMRRSCQLCRSAAQADVLPTALESSRKWRAEHPHVAVAVAVAKSASRPPPAAPRVATSDRS